MRASPGARIIVTSRAPLHIAGEHELPVAAAARRRRGPVHRSGAGRAPGWEPGDDAPVIAEICSLLDGLPLGIELAAARIGSLPPVGIRDRLAARLPLPGQGVRDAPARQRTLDAAVAWSHDLLDARLQRLLHELAVFEGGFDVEQVDAMSAVGGQRRRPSSRTSSSSPTGASIVAVPHSGGRAGSGCCGRSRPTPLAGLRPTATRPRRDGAMPRPILALLDRAGARA